MTPADHRQTARAVVAVAVVLVVGAAGAALTLLEGTRRVTEPAERPASESRDGNAIVLAERLYYAAKVLDAAWVGHLHPEGVRLRVMSVRWHWRPERAYEAYMERTGVDLLIVNEEGRVWAHVGDIDDARASCDGADTVFVGGTAVGATPHGLSIRDPAMSYVGLCTYSDADPKGCFHDSAVLRSDVWDMQAAAAPPGSIALDDAVRGALESAFPRIDGPPDNPKERTFEVLAEGHTERGPAYVVHVRWVLMAMLSPHGGADLFWVTAQGDIIASISCVPRDAILDVRLDQVRLRGLEGAVRFRDGMLEASVRYLDPACGCGPFARD